MALFHVILNLCMDKCFINRWFQKQDVKRLGDCHGVMGSYVSCPRVFTQSGIGSFGGGLQTR